jgi:hypothetical protein
MILLITTYTCDIVRYHCEKKYEKRLGGPALFIERALHQFGKKALVHTGVDMSRIEIILSADGETGSIASLSPIASTLPHVEGIEFVIVSTVANEFDLKALENVDCPIYIDVQGYVRSGYFDTLSSKDFESWHNVSIIKATSEEYEKIPRRLKSLFTNRMTLITKGAQGFDILASDGLRSYSVDPISAPDTIGAGDTFFAAFCVSYNQYKDSDTAAQAAIAAVSLFLKSK